MPVKISGHVYYRTLETCKKSGISRATLLRWIQAGILEDPHRDRRGWRMFTEDDLRQIQVEANRIRPKKNQLQPIARQRKLRGRLK